MPRISRPWRPPEPAPVTGPGEGSDPQPQAENPQRTGQGPTPTDPQVIDRATPAPSPAVAEPTPAPVQATPASPAPVVAGVDPGAEKPGFGMRGRMRRRLYFLRKARELGYRDLGGLVFDLHRFRQRHDELVVAKLATLEHIDRELRALESALHERQDLTVLREAGIAACPRCAAIHGSDDRFCPSCGMPISPHVDLPIAAPASSPVLGAVATGTAAAVDPAHEPSPPPVGASQPWPGVSADPTVRGATGHPADLLRPAAPAQAASGEDQPTQVIPPAHSQAVEQPTQVFDQPGSEQVPQPDQVPRQPTAGRDG